MKKLLLISILVFALSFVKAQDSNVLIGLAGPAYGVTVKTNFPNGTGGWARGFKVANQDNSTSFITFGAYGGYLNGTSSLNYSFIGPSYSSTYMVFLPTGDIGIGTRTPREKLSVNGNIRAKEIKVETANWPDYVFDETYKMPSLTETETYIKEHRHLPGMPNKNQVAEEGVSLGEMNRKLLEKVEELTLHLIEKEKTINQLSDRLTALENKPK